MEICIRDVIGDSREVIKTRGVSMLSLVEAKQAKEVILSNELSSHSIIVAWLITAVDSVPVWYSYNLDVIWAKVYLITPSLWFNVGSKMDTADHIFS